MDAQTALAIDVVTVVLALGGLVLAVMVMFCGWSSIRDEKRNERRRHGRLIPHLCDRLIGANNSHKVVLPRGHARSLKRARNERRARVADLAQRQKR